MLKIAAHRLLLLRQCDPGLLGPTAVRLVKFPHEAAAGGIRLALFINERRERVRLHQPLLLRQGYRRWDGETVAPVYGAGNSSCGLPRARQAVDPGQHAGRLNRLNCCRCRLIAGVGTADEGSSRAVARREPYFPGPDRRR
jgi:hypothetical protein